MNAADERAALELEFDIFARRAQLEVPADRRAQLLEDFAELHRMVRAIRTPRTADLGTDETFDLDTVIRVL